MSSSPFAPIEQAPPDPIIGLTEAFNQDSNPAKVNLGVGVYQDADGKVPVLKVVREAESRWYAQENTKSYLPIDGLAAYNKEVQKSGSAARVGKTTRCCLKPLALRLTVIRITTPKHTD
jgi:aromatic-amino-acid transaminase